MKPESEKTLAYIMIVGCSDDSKELADAIQYLGVDVDEVLDPSPLRDQVIQELKNRVN